jgi:CheY-like chemotaxis protein
VAWDITQSRRLQRKIDAIDLAGRELVEIDREAIANLNVEERLEVMEQKIYKYMHDLLNFDNFVVMLLDRKTGHLDMVLQHGMVDDVRRLDIYASTENNGISGYVAATGRSYICPDTRNDPRYIRGLDKSGSSLTVPLRLHDEVVGVFDIESERVAAFNEDDRQFAEILGRYVATALNVFDLLITERFTATGRLADDVAGEIAGPLNDILTQAATLMEDYIGHDDLRKRLGTICDDVASIRTTIREVGQPQCGVLGRASAEDSRIDPALAGKRVLVADDECMIRDSISGILRCVGCDVDIACDGEIAVALIGQNDYDLVLADIKMPKQNGYEVFAKARDRRPNRPVILMTGFGYDPNHSIVRARREGLSAVLFKPFKADQLLEEVRRAIAHPA